MKKPITLIVFFALVLSVLTGCTGKTNEQTKSNGLTESSEQIKNTEVSKQPEATSQTQKPVTFQLSIWGGDSHVKMYNGLADKYKETNPDVSVEVQIIPWADYQQKISILKAADQAPDISWLAERMLPQFLETKQLVDISELSSDNNYEFDDIIPATLELAKKDGKYYGIAFSTPPVVTFYNKTLFKEKNLLTPMDLHKEGKWNYDAMVSAAKSLTDKAKGIYGIKLNSTTWKDWASTIIPLTWGFGGDIFAKDNEKFNINTTEGEKAVQLYMDMIFKDESNPKPGDAIDFQSGKIGMYWGPISQVKNNASIKDFEWDIAPVPNGPANGPTLNGYAAYVMFSNSNNDSNKDARLALFKYLTGKEAMTVTSKYWIPSRKSIYSNDTFLEAYSAASRENVQACLDQISKGLTLPSHMNWQKIDTEAQMYFDLLYTKSITVKEALQQMEEKISPLLK